MHVVAIVPGHRGRIDDLIAEIERWLPVTATDAIDLVWGGDPHHRPAPPSGGRWADLALEPIAGIPWGVAHLAVGEPTYELARGLAVAAEHPPAEGPVLVVNARSVAVTGAVVPPVDAVGLLHRCVPPDDGLAPTIGDLAERGAATGSAVSATPADAAVLVGRLLAAGPDEPIGRALAAATSDRPTAGLPGRVLGWPPSPGAGTALVDLADLDPDDRWRVGVGARPARFLLSDDAAAQPLVLAFARTPPPSPPALTGGLEVDAVVRRLVADAVAQWRLGEGVLPPDPWADAGAFLDWLETPARPWDPPIGRYWYELWRSRLDLQARFPDLQDEDQRRFVDWAGERYRHEPWSPVLGVRARRTARWRTASSLPGGVDLIGYFGTEVSLANLAERVRTCLQAAAVPHTTLDYDRSGSPRRAGGADTDDVLRYDTVLAIVNPDQVPHLLSEYGDVLRGRRMIGYWHWDVEYVPDRVARQMRHFEQIWVLNEYTERTLSAVPGAPPVRSLPVRVPEPAVSAATRADLGLPADRFVFLVTFDHLSVTERKHPIGAIEAFRRAFPEPTERGPVLIVKTMNAARRWVEHERVRLAALDRPDVLVVDRLLPIGDQMALIAHADCLVSLHRAEGLGLHLVEAMWLSTPTIATRYSGNLSFMDDDDALLVDATMTPVTRGEGFFPTQAEWADPDLDRAAQHMRRIVADPDLARRLAAAGRARMEQQPTFEATGRTIAAWCGIEGGTTWNG